MRIDIITVLPEMFESILGCSILKRAQNASLAEIVVHNLRDYTTNKHRKVDDYPFGGDAGMVIQIEPVDRCISHLKSQRNYDEVIFTAPDGEVFNQRMANRMSMMGNIIILCGHYKGIDYRIREHLITKERRDTGYRTDTRKAQQRLSDSILHRTYSYRVYTLLAVRHNGSTARKRVECRMCRHISYRTYRRCACIA